MTTTIRLTTPPTTPPTVRFVWFRDDLRTDDHPALSCAMAEASRRGGSVVGVYVLDDALWGRPLGGASLWWLHHSLKALAARLRDLSVPLILRRGSVREILPDIARRVPTPSVHWVRGQTPFLCDVEETVAAALSAADIPAVVTGEDLLASPKSLRGGTPYKVFTPFWRALSALTPQAPLPIPSPLVTPSPIGDVLSFGDRLEDWHLLPTSPDWADGLRASWTPGEDGALTMLSAFLEAPLDRYGQTRNHPAVAGTSRLSPHLRFGELSTRRLWSAIISRHGPDALPFLRQVGWREFNHHLLFQAPQMASLPLTPAFAHFPWRDDRQDFRRWCRGRTGFPIVDAGMRELWISGWMHNRVRLIAASFLVKDLLLPWQWGESWMWDTLVDACPANNPCNWQWIAGCGADAAPYFRIFNPTLQAQKFDPDGAYVQTWVADYKKEKYGGENVDLFSHASLYPSPMVDHKAARARALQALQAIKPKTFRGGFDTPHRV